MNIKEIPTEERPRERMINYGSENLSNEELISIILRCGTKNKSVKDLALYLLKDITSLTNLQNMTYNRLISIKGIGASKATMLMASVELGRRIFLNSSQNVIKFTNPQIIFDNTHYLFKDKKQELFYCIYLDSKNKMIGKELLFIGTVNKSLVHPREIFKYAYLYSASSIVCLHNHPSDDVTPSRDDILITEILIEIGQIQKIPILDHIIIANNNYYSFSDNGKINNGDQSEKKEKKEKFIKK